MKVYVSQNNNKKKSKKKMFMINFTWQCSFFGYISKNMCLSINVPQTFLEPFLVRYDMNMFYLSRALRHIRIKRMYTGAAPPLLQLEVNIFPNFTFFWKVCEPDFDISSVVGTIIHKFDADMVGV